MKTITTWIPPLDGDVHAIDFIHTLTTHESPNDFFDDLSVTFVTLAEDSGLDEDALTKLCFAAYPLCTWKDIKHIQKNTKAENGKKMVIIVGDNPLNMTRLYHASHIFHEFNDESIIEQIKEIRKYKHIYESMMKHNVTLFEKVPKCIHDTMFELPFYRRFCDFLSEGKLNEKNKYKISSNVISIVVCSILCGCWLYKRTPKWLDFIGAYFFADIGSGMFHKYFDLRKLNFNGSKADSMAIDFQLHHYDPSYITQRHFASIVGEVCNSIISLLPITLIFLHKLPTFAGLGLFLSIFTNVNHCLAHRRTHDKYVPEIIKKLQDYKVILNNGDHRKHHMNGGLTDHSIFADNIVSKYLIPSTRFYEKYLI